MFIADKSVKTLVEYIAEKRAERRTSRILSSAGFVAGLLLIIAASVCFYLIHSMPEITWVGVLLIGGGVIAAMATVVAMVVGVRYLIRIGELTEEIEVNEARKKSMEGLDSSLEDESANSYFNSLVKINVGNLGEYYALVQRHANRSFNITWLVGATGFVLIGAGLAFGFVNGSSNQTVSYLATGSGVVVEFISGIFFYLYNRTVVQMKKYHDSLIQVQNILLSFKLVGDSPNEVMQSESMSILLQYLVRTKDSNQESRSDGTAG